MFSVTSCKDITAEEERHAKQAAAMAAFCAAEQDEAAATFGKEAADAAVDRMKNRLEALKRVQVPSPPEALTRV